MQNFELVAHRGYPKRYPDNSLVGIRAVLDAGARNLEIDVQLSTSGTPWLFHDDTLGRVCGLGGRLTDLADEGVASLRASEAPRFGSRFVDEPVARLSDVARELEGRPGIFTFVEIKPIAVEAFGAEAVVDAVAAELQGLTGRVAIISFDVTCLEAAAARTPHEIGLILSSWVQLESDYAALAPQHVFCDVEKLPRKGKLELAASLAVYEIIVPEQALELGERGAQYIETFAYPEMRDALDLLDE
jgi:glycerophosphoryl diester phosphodiesterase